ncbi:MAG TPA: AMP-binding protein [Burkholderiales bacterium]|nr:AMP-binding protein [Burkholderiales bacterium]
MSASGRPPAWELRSSVPGATWPALPAPGAAAALALLWQLERSERLDPAALRALQLRQLEALLAHAWASVPWYREHWAGRYDPARQLSAGRFAELPLLPRRALQLEYDALNSAAVPPEHGALSESRTSGATGSPVRVRKTGLTTLLWNAFTLRDHRWHGRDLRRKLAVIRQGLAPGEAPNWGSATAGLVETGPCVMLGPQADIDAQLAWLEREQPAYLLTYPSSVAELARASLARGAALHELREVRTLGESLDPETRTLCREAWGVPLTDVYSAEECGYIALQCPEGEHYHVQAEGVLVEVLDEHGAPCAPGQTGRVALTSLHNFATPLVRYELGDYAEVGEPCACGRGLPVLKRVLGRVRNMLVTADGRRYWPTFGVRSLSEVAPVLQVQCVQKRHDLVEARIVASAPLEAAQEAELRARILSRLPPGIALELSYPARIERSAGGKFEDFVCELSA